MAVNVEGDGVGENDAHVSPGSLNHGVLVVSEAQVSLYVQVSRKPCRDTIEY